jgi:hypothetical protein
LINRINDSNVADFVEHMAVDSLRLEKLEELKPFTFLGWSRGLRQQGII